MHQHQPLWYKLPLRQWPLLLLQHLHPWLLPRPCQPLPHSWPQRQHPVATGAPFSDPKGLIDYVMGAYKALGPQKGAMIQGVLTGLGYQNINDVKPEHYAALHTGVESLKG